MLSVDKKVMEASYSRGGLDTQKVRCMPHVTSYNIYLLNHVWLVQKMVKFYTAGMQGISTASLIAMHNGSSVDSTLHQWLIFILLLYSYGVLSKKH